jgi:tRNA nucleotidyltransferase/poly(A) polymerase
MPDYIYLLEKRLSADQRNALRYLRDAAREAEMILFLTGDAVRDLTSGHAVRDLEVAVHGNALELKTPLADIPVQIWGEDAASRSLYLCFPGTVRVDVVSTHRTEYPKPGQPVYHAASIQEDLRRRDFTVNAMAISLNEGSFGLLMDPLNGAADIEARTLRLVSNYGFLEEPALLVRATRYLARMGWELDPKTQTRYENAKGEGVIEFLSDHARSQELEQIGHEDDGLKILRALEAEGWMKSLCPAWTSAKADEEKLKALHGLAVELLMQGVHADVSAAQMQLLTAKLPAKELAALKKQLLRPGFVQEWNNLDALAAAFAKVLLAKENQVPSASFRLFTSYDPEAVLWLGFTTKDAAVKERFNLFLKVWPETRQRMPYALMQEMRIRPELPNYNEILHAVFLELIDGHHSTPEEMRAFLEPYSPPAPPPQVTIKRTRGKRGGEPKIKDNFDEEEESEDGLDGEEDLDDMGGEDDEIGIGMGLPKVADLEADTADDADSDDDAEEDEEDEVAEPQPAAAKRGAKKQAEAVAPVRRDAGSKALPVEKPTKGTAATAHVAAPKAVAPPAAAKHAVPAAKSHPAHTEKKTAPGPAPVKTSKGAPAKSESKHAPAKPASKAAHSTSTKAHAKTPAKPLPGKGHAAAHPVHSKASNGAKSHVAAKPAAKKAAVKKH